MDTAGQLKIVAFNDGKKVSEELINIPDYNPYQRVLFIRNLGIDILICGAVSHQLESMLRRSGIDLISWVRGNIDDVISACTQNNFAEKIYYMPGYKCGIQGRGRGRGRGHGRRAFDQRRKIQKEDL